MGSYTACYPEHDPENSHVKSIVNMDFVYQTGGDPHHFRYHVSLHPTVLGRALLGNMRLSYTTYTPWTVRVILKYRAVRGWFN